MGGLIKPKYGGFFLLLFILLLAGCSNGQSAEMNTSEIYYRYSGDLLSIVNQQKSAYGKKIGSKYTVTAVNTAPEPNLVRDDPLQLRSSDAVHFQVTDKTRIYKQIIDHSKQIIDMAELESNIGQRIEFWIKPMDDDPHELEAAQIVLIAEPLVITTSTLPDRWHGYAEDEILAIRFKAELEPEQHHYKTKVTFTNKTDKALEILADCGLFFSDDHDAAGAENCPAIESMLLLKRKQETQTVILPPEYFEPPYKVIYIRYRQDRNVKELHLHLSQMKQE